MRCFLMATLLAAGCACKQPQAVKINTELDSSVVLALKALPNLPEVEIRNEFKRKTDALFKTTPGVDALDIMLYRICVMCNDGPHQERFTPEMQAEMVREAYRTWLKYVQGLETAALERVKSGLDGQPLGPPKAVASSVTVPPELQERVRAAALKAIALEAVPDGLRGEPQPPDR